jgi:hypothetical protein
MAWSKIENLKPALLEYSSTGGYMNKSAQASISKLAQGHYYIEGEDSAGNPFELNIDSIDKLAFWTLSVGGSIEDLESFYDLADVRSVDLANLNRGVQLKVANSQRVTKRASIQPYHQTLLKNAQDELADSMEAQAQTPGNTMPQKDTMADLLSLLSIGDDSVIEFIQNKEQIRSVEDGVGKILFNIRKGAAAGSESAMSRALRSIGGIYETIETIENDLRARGEIQ